MANSATVGILRVLLTADIAELSTGMDKAAGEFKKIDKELGALQKQWAVFWGGDAVKVLSGVGVAAAGALVGLGAASLKYAADLDDAATLVGHEDRAVGGGRDTDRPE